MKKLLATALALVMLLGLCVTVSGAETETFYYYHDEGAASEVVLVEVYDPSFEVLLGEMTHLGDVYPGYENYYYLNVGEGTEFGAFVIQAFGKSGSSGIASPYSYARGDGENLFDLVDEEWKTMILPEGFDPNPSEDGDAPVEAGQPLYIVSSLSEMPFDPRNPDTMTWNAEKERWEITYTNVSVGEDSGEYSYKVRDTIGAWEDGITFNEEGYGPSSEINNAKFTVAVDGSTVLICCNGERTYEIVTDPNGNVTSSDAPEDDTPAGSDSKGERTESIAVSAGFEKADKQSVVSVDLKWGGMQFVYAQEMVQWSPETHEYVPVLDEEGQPVQEGGWTLAEDSDNFITITNHSNVSVDAGLSFAAEADMEITGKFFEANDATSTETTSISLDSAEDAKESGVVPERTVYFFVTDGEIEEDMDKIGTITVTIEAEEVAKPEEGGEAENKIMLTFEELTPVENGFEAIYIYAYDAEGNEEQLYYRALTFPITVELPEGKVKIKVSGTMIDPDNDFSFTITQMPTASGTYLLDFTNFTYQFTPAN